MSKATLDFESCDCRRLDTSSESGDEIAPLVPFYHRLEIVEARPRGG